MAWEITLWYWTGYIIWISVLFGLIALIWWAIMNSFFRWSKAYRFAIFTWAITTFGKERQMDEIHMPNGRKFKVTEIK